MSKNVYITVLTNTKYIPGLKALKKSLFKTKTKYDLGILIPENKKQEFESILIQNKIIDDRCFLITRPNIEVNYPPTFKYLGHYWVDTFFKIQCSSCTEFKKVVLLDSDLLIVKNVDELFTKGHYSGVAADQVNHPNTSTLNSGVLVLEPSKKLHDRLLLCLKSVIKQSIKIDYKVGDQDVFNEAFPDWINHKELVLPETYNSFFYEINKMCKLYGYKKRDIKIAHFTGAIKPWHNKMFSKYNIKLLLSLIKKIEFYKLHLYLKYLRYSK